MSDRLQNVFDMVDKANLEDPNSEIFGGIEYKKEYLYGLRLCDELSLYAPNASDVLKIAARAQHIRRWELKRTDFDPGRAGYLKWRQQQGIFHGDVTANIMEQNGYGQEECQKVRSLLSKKQLKTDSDMQTLEDVICLVFIKYYLADFAQKHSEEKIKDILLKTLDKMSDNAKKCALSLKLAKETTQIVQNALGER